MDKSALELRAALTKTQESLESHDDRPVIIEATESVGILYELDGLKLVMPVREHILKGKLRWIEESDRLMEIIAQVRRDIELDSQYFNYKDSTKYYTILDIVSLYNGNSKNFEISVLYKADYEELEGVEFVRPLAKFFEEIPEAGNQPRFQAVQ